MTDLRLVIFDVDGTLIDSQSNIVAAMQAAYGAQGLDCPDADAIRSIIGLSLPDAFNRLSPDADTGQLTADYKAAFQRHRASGAHHAPLYPGIADVLSQLHAEDETLLAVATGKSMRGLRAVLDMHDLHGRFISLQTADHHPSKPHPAMIMAAVTDAGVAPEQAVMVGDTTYDMDMARAAGVAAIGVSWGYHPAERLEPAHIVTEAGQLHGAIAQALRSTT